MKKYLVAAFALFFIVGHNHAQLAGASDSLAQKRFTSAQLKEDFIYLRKMLEETHPGLYRYTSRMMMQQKLDSLYGLLDREMSYYEYHVLLSDLIASVRCSHTYLVPQKDMNRYMISIKSIPFELSASRGRVYTVLNGTSDETVKPGSELMSIMADLPPTYLITFTGRSG